MRSTKGKLLQFFYAWTCLHQIVILRSQNKITDFFMILAWVWAFNPCAPSIICKKYYFILKQIYINLKILLQKTYQLKNKTF